MKDEASYQCEFCGEEIVVPHRPHGRVGPGVYRRLSGLLLPEAIHLEIGDDGELRMWAQRE